MRVQDYLQKADELAGKPLPARYAKPTKPPGPVHVALVDTLETLLSLLLQYVQRSDKVHPMLAAIPRIISAQKESLLQDFADVPEAEIKAFLGGLSSRIQVVLDTPTADAKRATRPRANKSPAA